MDGDRCAWIVVGAGNRKASRQILPPAYRSHAKVVKLNKFTVESLEEIMRHYGG
ncbi:MAG: hypothetical protein GF355_00690 [Candidatus Eisenbacteria bacterium]|nr:hypothetical protein [Candidatus Eisenbacteria bacterium]